MQHAINVLERIELSDFFDEIYDIKMANYIPKPELAPYEQMIKKYTKQKFKFRVLVGTVGTKNLINFKSICFSLEVYFCIKIG